MSETGDIILRFRPTPDGLDHLGRAPEYRVKLLLKRALRCFGLRCVQIDPADPPRPDRTHDKLRYRASATAKTRPE